MIFRYNYISTTVRSIKAGLIKTGPIKGQWFCAALFLLAVLCLSGCGEFFATKPTEIEARGILEDLGQVRESPHAKNPLPKMYREPAKRITVKDGVKLFYFTKQHTVDKLEGLVTVQLGNKVSQSGPTNQLIIHCANDEDADKVLEFLSMVDVPPIQVNVDCIIIERFGDVTMDWETSILIENLMGKKITLGEARGGFTDGVLSSLEPAFPGAALRETTRSTFGLDFGYWINKGVPGHQVRTIVDMLESRGYLKILLNPTLETVNGQKATVTIQDNVGIQQTVTAAGVPPYDITTYQWVKDTLTVTPSVFADGSIGLKTDITIGSSSKPEGVVQKAIITERSISVEENRIKPGESLIIGGMRKSEKRSVIRGIPFFKDLPLIGVLFSSKDFEEKATEIIFILTPSISSGSVEHKKMIKFVKEKHASPEYKAGLTELFTDPFASTAYTGQVEREALEAEKARKKAEAETEKAVIEVEEIKKKLSETAEQFGSEKIDLQRSLEEAQAKVEALKAATEKAKAEEQKAKAETQKASAEKKIAQEEKAVAEAETRKVLAEAEKARNADEIKENPPQTPPAEQ